MNSQQQVVSQSKDNQEASDEGRTDLSAPQSIP